jgi:hypothetical protein
MRAGGKFEELAPEASSLAHPLDRETGNLSLPSGGHGYANNPAGRRRWLSPSLGNEDWGDL